MIMYFFHQHVSSKIGQRFARGQVPQTTLREQLQEVPQVRTVEVLREAPGR